MIDGVHCYDPYGEEGYRGPHSIYITNCENVTVTNLLRPSCCKADPHEPLTVHLKNVRTAWRDGGDRPLLARLQSFISDKVFDAHCHPHRADFFPDDCNMFRAYGTADAKRCLADRKELHCARGFAAWTTVSTARELAGIPNISYDMGAICDPATIFELIRQVGPEHVAVQPRSAGGAEHSDVQDGAGSPVCLLAGKSDA